MKNILMVAGIIVIGTGAYLLFMPTPTPAVTPESQTVTESGAQQQPENSQTMPMRAENNAVFVFEQRPGRKVVGGVFLEAPGYMVIHEAKGDEHGAIIGSSALLQAGDNTNVEVTLSRAAKNGETLHAMLHFEKGGNTTFSAAEDTSVPSALGGAIFGIFDVSVDAPENPEIVI